MSYRPNLIYATDYGSNARGDGLSVMCTRTLKLAIALINSDTTAQHVLAYCGADLPEHRMIGPQALEWKDAIVDERLRVAARKIRVTASNTITEAEHTRDALRTAGITPGRIIVYAEWWHSWRVAYVWRRTFPQHRIEIRTIPWARSEDYILPVMRSWYKWPLFNIAGLAYTVLLGIDRAKRRRQPIPRARS